jgi:antirestriction protein ArdC
MTAVKTRKAKNTKATERKDLYQETTDAIVASIEAGTVPWRKPWKGSIAAAFCTDGRARNAISLKPYRGSNIFQLEVSAALQGFTDPRWLTFKQARDAGGAVKKGEKGTTVVFWKFFRNVDPDTEKVTSVPMLRHYVVFNVEQCADTLKLPSVELPSAEVPTNERCEAVIRDMPKRPAMNRFGSAAYYRPSTDEVTMPAQASFHDPEEWYNTAFHELAHSTGHESRLNRSGITEGVRFGDAVYSFEELVAELAAAMVARATGIDPKVDQSAAYIEGWSTRLKSDPKMFLRAAGQAQKAADAILGETPVVVKEE